MDIFFKRLISYAWHRCLILTEKLTINDVNEQSTCHDITDVFDESQEPTLTLGSDNNADDVIDAPELPRDSGSSRESTPGTKRKMISTGSLVEREREFIKLRNYKVSVPSQLRFSTTIRKIRFVR